MIIKGLYFKHGISLLCLLGISSTYAAPFISEIQGNIARDQTITIIGTGFTDKAEARPLFWWRADDSPLGQTPSSLGRKTDWDLNSFNGTPSQTIVSPGSQQSIAWDHGLSEDAALSRLEINSPRLYLHRKLYEDFDIVKDVAIRTWVATNSIVGTINIGDTITGGTSGANGVVVQIYPDDGANRTSIFYKNTTGTVAANPPVDFLKGETMTGPTSRMTNVEPYGVGVARTFNYKPIRYWNYAADPSKGSDILVAAQGDEGASYRITPEGTDSTLFSPTHFVNPLSQTPRKWLNQEVEYQASNIDAFDGKWYFYQNGLLGSNKTIRTRTTERPALYHALFQSQVSNGAQPGSVVYYDSLYIDDTWHRVIICSGETLDQCTDREIQIPISWTDNQITVELNLGGLNQNSPLFLYIVDQNGVPNNSGWPLCPKCPKPPIPNSN